MLLNPFRVDWRNSLYFQGLRCVTHSGIKIADLSACRCEGIDRVFIPPFRDAASSLSVFNRLLAIAKCWVRTSCLKPGALFQNSAQGNTSRVDRNEITKLLRCFRVFPKVRVDTGTQKGSLDESGIFPQRFVTIR